MIWFYISAAAEKLVKNYLTLISFKNLFKKIIIHCNYFNLLSINATSVNKKKKNSKRTETLLNKYHFAVVQSYCDVKYSFPEMF